MNQSRTFNQSLCSSCLLFAFLLTPLVVDEAFAYPETRVKVNHSMTVEYAGSAEKAFYAIDNDTVYQYDHNAKLRHTQAIGPGELFRFSPDGYHYVVLDGKKSDDEFTPYTLFDVMHREVYSGKAFTGGKLFVDNDGRCALVKPRVGSSVEILILDQSGENLGLGTVGACDTIAFAPDTRGFITSAAGKGLSYLRLTGEKIANYPPSDYFDFSLTGRKVILFHRGVVTLYDDAKIFDSFRAPNSSALKLIYNDNKRIVFMLTRKSLYSLRATDGKVLLDYFAVQEGWIYEDFAYTPVSDLLALSFTNTLGSVVAVEDRAKQSSLRILTPEGIERPLIHDITETARPPYPRVQMGSKGHSVFFILADGFQRVMW